MSICHSALPGCHCLLPLTIEEADVPRQGSTRRMRLQPGPGLSPSGKGPCLRSCKRSEVGHSILSSPGLAQGQARSGKQEGTHSGKARSPAKRRRASQQGLLGARCSSALWRSGSRRMNSGFSRLSFQRLKCLPPPHFQRAKPVEPRNH